MSYRAPAPAAALPPSPSPLPGPARAFFMGRAPHDGESRSKCAVTFR